MRARRGAREQLLVKPFALEALVGTELCPHSNFSSLWLWEVGSNLSSLHAAEAGGSPGAAGVAHPHLGLQLRHETVWLCCRASLCSDLGGECSISELGQISYSPLSYFG